MESISNVQRPDDKRQSIESDLRRFLRFFISLEVSLGILLCAFFFNFSYVFFLIPLILYSIYNIALMSIANFRFNDPIEQRKEIGCRISVEVLDTLAKIMGFFDLLTVIISLAVFNLGFHGIIWFAIAYMKEFSSQTRLKKFFILANLSMRICLLLVFLLFTYSDWSWFITLLPLIVFMIVTSSFLMILFGVYLIRECRRSELNRSVIAIRVALVLYNGLFVWQSYAFIFTAVNDNFYLLIYPACAIWTTTPIFLGYCIYFRKEIEYYLNRNWIFSFEATETDPSFQEQSVDHGFQEEQVEDASREQSFARAVQEHPFEQSSQVLRSRLDFLQQIIRRRARERPSDQSSREQPFDQSSQEQSVEPAPRQQSSSPIIKRISNFFVRISKVFYKPIQPKEFVERVKCNNPSMSSLSQLDQTGFRIRPQENSVDLSQIILEPDLTECAVCFNQRRSIVFLPCGHGGVCNECACRIKSESGICHICRANIEEVVEVEQNQHVAFSKS